MADNIFGTSNPQLKGDGDPNSTVVNLYRVEYLDRDFAIPQSYEGISPITGFRNFGLLGDYSHFKMIVNIFKYTTGTHGDTTTTMLQKLRTYHGKFVYFRPHRHSVNGNDLGRYMQDSAGNNIKYFLTVIPVALEGVPYDSEKIQVILDFNSQKYTDIVKTLDILIV